MNWGQPASGGSGGASTFGGPGSGAFGGSTPGASSSAGTFSFGGSSRPASTSGGVFGAPAPGAASTGSSLFGASSFASTSASFPSPFGVRHAATQMAPDPLAQENDRLRARVAELESIVEAMSDEASAREARRSQPREVADLLGLETEEASPSQEIDRLRARDTLALEAMMKTNFDNLEAMMKEVELRQGMKGSKPALPFRYSDETSPSDYETVLQRLGNEAVLVVFYNSQLRIFQPEKIAHFTEEIQKVQPNIRVVKVVAVVRASHVWGGLGAPAAFSYNNCSEGYPSDWEGPRGLTFRCIKLGKKVDDYTPGWNDGFHQSAEVMQGRDQDLARWNAFKRLFESP